MIQVVYLNKAVIKKSLRGAFKLFRKPKEILNFEA